MRSTKANQMNSIQGHLGAEHIWSSLRADSLKKLHVMDQKFPKELKEAVGAHVRDGLMKHKKPISRNFVVTDDVPDLKELMDQSHVKQIKTERHKTQLMYQSSQINQDRSKILLFNNPLPNLSEDGIKKFLPSVNESTELIDINSEIENLKPLNTKKNYSARVLSPLGSDVSETLQELWSAVLYRKESRKQPRYHFLTEKETNLKGQFRQKFESYKSELEPPKTLYNYKAIEHNPSWTQFLFFERERRVEKLHKIPVKADSIILHNLINRCIENLHGNLSAYKHLWSIRNKELQKVKVIS